MANILIRREVAGAPTAVWAAITDEEVLRASGARADDGAGSLLKGARVAFAGIDWKVALLDGPNVMVWVHREAFGSAGLKVRFALTSKAHGTELTVVASTTGLLGWTMRGRVSGLREEIEALARAMATRSTQA